MTKYLYFMLDCLSVVSAAIFLKSQDANFFLHGSKVKRASGAYSSCVTSESYCESNVALCTGAGREVIRAALCSSITCPLGQMCDMMSVVCPPHTTGVCQPAVVNGTNAIYPIGTSSSGVTGTTAIYPFGASSSGVTDTTAIYPIGASSSGDADNKVLIIGLSVSCPLLAIAATIFIVIICRYKKRGKVSPSEQNQDEVKETMNGNITRPNAVP